MGMKEGRRDPVLNFKSQVLVSLHNTGPFLSPRLGPTEAQVAFTFPVSLGLLFRRGGKPIGIPNRSHHHPLETLGASCRAASRAAMAAPQREGRRGFAAGTD
jgi:hypothetical protein